MKHIFIINPTAGKGKAAKKIIPVINSYCKHISLTLSFTSLNSAETE